MQAMFLLGQAHECGRGVAKIDAMKVRITDQGG